MKQFLNKSLFIFLGVALCGVLAFRHSNGSEKPSKENNHFISFIATDTTDATLDSLALVKKERKPLHTDENKVLITKKVAEIIQFWNYKKEPLNDSISGIIWKNFLDAIDGGRNFLLKKEIDDFGRYKHQLDDALLNGDLSPFYNLFNLYAQRSDNRYEYAINVLKEKFNFDLDDEYIYDRKEKAFETMKESDAWWRKKVKYDLLVLQIDSNNIKRNKGLLKERYQKIINNSRKVNANDIFQIALNCYASAIDPHSNFLVPNNADNFNISQALSYAGIGATLTSRNELTEIVSLNPKGPAFAGGQLSDGDRITAVAQGEKGEFVNVIGWRIDDVVSKIRGEAGTVVRLKIIPKGEKLSSEPKIISITRATIVLEQDRAHASIKTETINNKEYKIGIIPLKSFYLDFKAMQKGDPNYNSTSRDVRAQIDSLKNEGVQGLVIDLRNNGGGSLKEAIDLTGLFIKTGPVVQIKDSREKIYVDEDKAPDVVWNGPLAILVNRNSASASEIFAAAIQDYGLGIIVGENSFGKGTVQQVVDLNQVVPGLKGEAGQLNVTIAKFYRITGESTQFKGVSPDFQFPESPFFDEMGEKAKPAALAWDKISTSQYKNISLLNSNLKSNMQKTFDSFLSKSPEYKVLLERYKDLKHDKEEKKDRAPLNMKKFEEERAKDKEEDLERSNKYRKILGLKELKKGEKAPKGEKRQDVYKESAIRLLIDWINQKPGIASAKH